MRENVATGGAGERADPRDVGPASDTLVVRGLITTVIAPAWTALRARGVAAGWSVAWAREVRAG